mgnify:FL=1
MTFSNPHKQNLNLQILAYIPTRKEVNGRDKEKRGCGEEDDEPEILSRFIFSEVIRMHRVIENTRGRDRVLGAEGLRFARENDA